MDAPAVTIDLPGTPVGKGRPRFRIVNTKDGRQFGNVYTDAKTAGYEKALQQLAAIMMKRRSPLEGALRIRVTATFRPPESWSNRKADRAIGGEFRPTARPDFDNLAKMIDALKGIVWADDSQVVDAHVLKFYGAQASLKVEVWEMAPCLLDAGAREFAQA